MKDNQPEQPFTEQTAESEATAFQELDNETAAAIQGGSITVYKDSNQRNWLGHFKQGAARLSPPANNQISSIHVHAGIWRLYDLPGANSRPYVEYGPGKHNIPWSFNDRTSSLKKIRN